MTRDLPPIQHNPPDELTAAAAELHEVVQMLAPTYGQPDSGIPWNALPLSRKQHLRHTVLTLHERGTLTLARWT